MESIDLSLLVPLDAMLQEISVSKAARRLGLSTPAMSHALARARSQLGDPLLVRAGRSMVLTPRAEAIKARVHTLVSEASQLLTPERPFEPSTLERTFVVHATDHVLHLLGNVLDAMLSAEAPFINLRFVPNTPLDATVLREGQSDLAVGIYGDLPPEMRTKQLLTDRLVCVVRKDHPQVGKRLTLEQFAGLSHVQVAPRGKPGGYLDDVLEARGLSRRVVRAIPYFLAAFQLVAHTDYILTVSERLAEGLAEPLGLRLIEPPLPLRPYALSMVWHPRYDGDAGHRFLRETLNRAAKQAAAGVHPSARTRLELKRSRTKQKGPVNR